MTVTLIVTMVQMKLKSFVIEPFVRKVNFGVITEPVFQNRKNAMEYVTVRMVRTKYNVVGKCIVVGEYFSHKIHQNCKDFAHPNSHNEFLCKTISKCIPQSAICDGTNDCNDQSDESSGICDQELCPLGTFKCSKILLLMSRFIGQCTPPFYRVWRLYTTIRTM